MANQWNIPPWLENQVKERDTACVHCGSALLPHQQSVKASASWEHIINDASLISRENICLCCRSCNASKGQKPLSAWLQSRYCKARSINAKTVAPIIKQALARGC